MTEVRIILGCDCKRSNGHIDKKSGIFAILEEGIRKLKTGDIIPARINTRCAHRATKICTSDCSSAITGFMINGRISFITPGKSI